MAAGSANGIGDPLLWSPENVRTLLDTRRRLLGTSMPHLKRAPDLLRDLIRHGHPDRGLHRELTAAALTAVDAAAPAFLAAVSEPDDDEPGS